MREIKFRGWHTIAKKMFSAEEMATDQLSLLPTGEFINVSGTSTRLSEIYPRDKFIPLQFTGLFDKQGKEIYEGDIIQPYFHKYVKSEVVKYENGGFSPFSIAGWEIVESPNSCEVIGNIYENSGLLKESEQ